MSQSPPIEKAFLDPQNRLEVAIYFPQGCRQIKAKGDNAGKSYSYGVSFKVEIKYQGQTNWIPLSNLSVYGTYKDAFVRKQTYTGGTELQALPGSQYFRNDLPFTIRVQRITMTKTEEEQEDQDYRIYSTSILQSITGYRSGTKPITDPVGTQLAKTALSVKATKQLSGQIEPINAIVHTYCKDYNPTTDTWELANTNNPASLYLYVLTHPGNPQRVKDTEISSRIDLDKLEYWHQYCANHSPKFEFNNVHSNTRGVLEVLRDICAAGRASPALVDGKWSVNIDEPKPITQHFSPHNSWGFESTKALPKIPDGLKIQFYNEEKNYKEDELIVFNFGKSLQTAELFESITLPGVTSPALVEDHGKWHFAQIKLRPEIYTINTDIEYLVCSRGDRVKVTHDVPMWGSGSGRINLRLSDEAFSLDEEIYIDVSKTYTIRVRAQDGSSITKTVVNPGTSGYYGVINILEEDTDKLIQPLDLFLFGELNKESQDLIVLSIEPTDGAKNAKLTLVDYGVEESYDIFTDYKDLTSVTYDPNITGNPPDTQTLLRDYTPQIDAANIKSDESAMTEISPGIFQYGILVPFTHDPRLLVSDANAKDIPSVPQFVQAEYYLTTQSNPVPILTPTSSSQVGSVKINDVDINRFYNIRLRYVTESGILGMWSQPVVHKVTGKLTPPQDVTNFQATVVEQGIDFTWDQCKDPDYTTTVLKFLEIPNPEDPLAPVDPLTIWNDPNAQELATVSGITWFWNNPETAHYYVVARHQNRAGVFSAGTAKVTFSFIALVYTNITVDITNDNHQIPTNAAGEEALLSESGAKIYVFQGGTLLKYNGIGTTIGTWKIQGVVASNVTYGGAQPVVDTVNGDDYATINDLTAVGPLDQGSIEYTIVGVDSIGQPFTTQRTQSFVKQKSGENPTLYYIDSTTPVVYKNSPDKDTPGEFSTITVLARKKIANNSVELYGWLGVVGYSGNTQIGPEAFGYQQVTATPDSNSTVTRWVLKMYDIDNTKPLELDPLTQTMVPARSTTVLDQEEIQVVFEGEVYDVQIESSNGTIFRPGLSANTVLTARVFKNGSEITDSLGSSSFRWRRVSLVPQPAPNDDATWNANHYSGFKNILVNVDDVYARATFFCDIVT